MQALVIENDPTVLLSLTKHLRVSGFEVTVCIEGVSALEAYRQMFYPLVVLAFDRPGIYGEQVCHQIRLMPKGMRSIILALTAGNEPEHTQTVFYAGADEYLSRPLDLKLLKRQLKTFEQRLQHLADREPLDEYLHQLEQAVAVMRERMAMTKQL